MRRYAARKFYDWTHELAYVSGLIASDGCLYGDGRHINLTSMDVDQLETVRQILSLKGGVKIKANGFGGIGYYIQFSDVALYDFFYNAGIKPAKSKTIDQILVPDKYYADFLRGYFDGDGSIYGFWDKRWRSSLMYYTEYVSASPQFLRWLQIENSRLALVSPGRIKASVRASALSYAKSDSKKLYQFMYYATDLPALDRKQKKFIALFTADPYADEELYARVAESADAPV